MTVTRLDLSGNEIGSSGLKHLASLFEENSTISELVSTLIAVKPPLPKITLLFRNFVFCLR